MNAQAEQCRVLVAGIVRMGIVYRAGSHHCTILLPSSILACVLTQL